MAPRLIVSEDDEPDLRRLLLRELAPMLYPAGPRPRPCWVCVAVPNRDGDPVGGLIGLIVGAWLTIDLLWLPEHWRGQGLGSALLAEVERNATRRNCLGATVSTTCQAACRFYERNGYVPRLRLPEVHPGYTQITLQKNFL